MRPRVGRRHHAYAARVALGVDLAMCAEPAGNAELAERPVVDAALVGERNLPGLAVVLDTFLGPRLDDDVDFFLEDTPVDVVVVDVLLDHVLAEQACRIDFGRRGRSGGAGAEVLADHVGPARLVAPRETDEEASVGEMIQDRGFLGDAQRMLRAHHIAHLANANLLGYRGPVGVEHAGVGADFVALGPEVMLDSGGAPQAHLVGGPDDVVPSEQGFVIDLAIAADRAQRRAFLFAGRGEHRVKLKYYFNHGFPFSGRARGALSRVPIPERLSPAGMPAPFSGANRAAAHPRVHRCRRIAALSRLITR